MGPKPGWLSGSPESLVRYTVHRTPYGVHHTRYTGGTKVGKMMLLIAAASISVDHHQRISGQTPPISLQRSGTRCLSF